MGFVGCQPRAPKILAEAILRAIVPPCESSSFHEDVSVQIPMSIVVARTYSGRVIKCRKTRIGKEKDQDHLEPQPVPAGVVPSQPFSPFGNQEEKGGDQL